MQRAGPAWSAGQKDEASGVSEHARVQWCVHNDLKREWLCVINDELQILPWQTPKYRVAHSCSDVLLILHRNCIGSVEHQSCAISNWHFVHQTMPDIGNDKLKQAIIYMKMQFDQVFVSERSFVEAHRREKTPWRVRARTIYDIKSPCRAKSRRITAIYWLSQIPPSTLDFYTALPNWVSAYGWFSVWKRSVQLI